MSRIEAALSSRFPRAERESSFLSRAVVGSRFSSRFQIGFFLVRNQSLLVKLSSCTNMENCRLIRRMLMSIYRQKEFYVCRRAI